MASSRRIPVALALAAALACSPSVNRQPSPTPAGGTGPAIDYAVFDPSASPPSIPLPNDLALQASAIAAQTGAQRELLSLFAGAGGFPNDQEVPITIDFQRQDIDAATGAVTPVPLDLDLTSFKVGTFAVLEIPASGPPAAAAVDAPVAADLVRGTDRSTLSLHHTADATTHSRAWKAGSRYVVAIRGGANGVKTSAGGDVQPMPVTYLITRGQDLTSPAYEALIPGETPAAKVATARQLEALRQSYLPAFQLVAFAAGIPTEELALIQTFQVAPARAGGAVVTDASAGVVPLPSDLLLDPATGGKTIVKSASFGALAAGIATLDGFSTTAMILSQTSSPVVAATVNKDTVFLYDLGNPAAPARVKGVDETGGPGAGYLAEPFVITRKADGTPCTQGDPATGCFSTAIGLQPATLLSASPLLSVPPLAEKREYAVLVTDGVLVAPTAAGAAPTPLRRSTLSSILLFQSPLASAAGKSLLAGQDDATSTGLEQIRRGVAVAAAALQAEKGIAASRIVLGYTFRTQSITSAALQLAAAPYQAAVAPAIVPGTPVNITAAVPAPPGPIAGAAEVLSVPVTTLNAIDVTTGALDPDPSKWTTARLNAIVVVPQSTSPNLAACPAPNGALRCAPLVVFQHGTPRTKEDVFAVASTLASAGFVVAAIDAPLHGERAYCISDAECTCTGSLDPACAAPKCSFFGPAGLQGDAVQIGACTGGSRPIPYNPDGSALTTGRFWVTLNLFRTRDTQRQAVLDTSALVLALAPPTPTANPLATELAARGIAIDASRVFQVALSFGGFHGTIGAAVNPRISRATLTTTGATIIDVAATSPVFAPRIDALLASQQPPVTRAGTPEAYLKFFQVAKLVMDAGEPVNFARHLKGDAAHPTLPSFLSASGASQPAKLALGQAAVCDQAFPVQTSTFLFDQVGLAAVSSPGSGNFTFGSFTVPTAGGSPPACTVANPADDPAHGFLLNFSAPATTLAAQGDIRDFLLAAPPAP